MAEAILSQEAYAKNVSAIILAGGFSQRMKDFKPLLPLGDCTIMENTIKVFQNAGIKDISVVIGYRAQELKILLKHAGIKWVYNENFHEGMYSSVIAGVKSLRKEAEGFFLLPADMPLVKAGTVTKIFHAYCLKGSSVIYPVFNGRCGHPPFISSRLFEAILAWSGAGGLRALLEQRKSEAQYVEVQDEGILIDVDTPEDYLNLCKVFN
jgi:molybdenum cofactor cytidylyltransferase